jgi:hypothetical protein
MRNTIISLSLFILTLTFGVSNVSAQSLLSPNFEIDALGFFASDTSTDFPPPAIISGPTVVSVTATSAIIEWTTDVNGNSFVMHGLDDTYGFESGQSEELVKFHTVKVIGLSPNKTYHYQVKSADIQGKYGRSTDQVLTTTNAIPISEVSINEITLNSAIVTWKTASVVNSYLHYGLNTSYSDTVSDASGSSTTNHAVRLSNLNQGTTYHLQVIGQDTVGQDVYSDDYIFTTLSLPIILRYSIGNVNGNTAEISWETNVAVDSFISFWKSTEDESTAQTQGSPELVKSHHLVLKGLEGKSEYKFRIVGRDIYGNSLRSEVLTFKTPDDVSPPVISDIKSEVSSNSKDDRLQLVVSWNTDEPANSQIEYNIGPASSEKYSLTTRLDESLNVNHIVIITPLQASTNYHFRVKAGDKAGNYGTSADYSVLTPQSQKSLLQIILEKLEQTFGWLRKVRF